MNAGKRMRAARSDRWEANYFLNPEPTKSWAKRESSRAGRGLDKDEVQQELRTYDPARDAAEARLAACEAESDAGDCTRECCCAP